MPTKYEYLNYKKMFETPNTKTEALRNLKQCIDYLNESKKSVKQYNRLKYTLMSKWNITEKDIPPHMYARNT